MSIGSSFPHTGHVSHSGHGVVQPVEFTEVDSSGHWSFMFRTPSPSSSPSSSQTLVLILDVVGLLLMSNGSAPHALSNLSLHPSLSESNMSKPGLTSSGHELPYLTDSETAVFINVIS